jgi:hypothetical protein
MAEFIERIQVLYKLLPTAKLLTIFLIEHWHITFDTEFSWNDWCVWLSMIIIVHFNKHRFNIIWFYVCTVGWVKTILYCRLPTSSNKKGSLKIKI